MNTQTSNMDCGVSQTTNITFIHRQVCWFACVCIVRVGHTPRHSCSMLSHHVGKQLVPVGVCVMLGGVSACTCVNAPHNENNDDENNAHRHRSIIHIDHTQVLSTALPLHTPRRCMCTTVHTRQSHTIVSHLSILGEMQLQATHWIAQPLPPCRVHLPHHWPFHHQSKYTLPTPARRWGRDIKGG